MENWYGKRLKIWPKIHSYLPRDNSDLRIMSPFSVYYTPLKPRGGSQCLWCSTGTEQTKKQAFSWILTSWGFFLFPFPFFPLYFSYLKFAVPVINSNNTPKLLTLFSHKRWSDRFFPEALSWRHGSQNKWLISLAKKNVNVSLALWCLINIYIMYMGAGLLISSSFLFIFFQL